ncbi:GNAT family N-acetyltransferase [Paralimibaculum aggregatum]|uniref:GNAT family N-acetyltransferase n=1 Tax=Paralimibaculum aggregatum TaxID=3036245 RepID=A0ABQ6LTZ2_9RHOB|nr:GNAT family N-acetyltransferase [Limibaculum sp. NKW23]GMG85549.1 GNAT family N-acetyltransferase [Limibaculum sp. NKW23]
MSAAGSRPGRGGPGELAIRTAAPGDADALWAMLEPEIRAGETYALPRGMSRADALGFWCGAPHDAFVAERGGQPLGTYFLRPNKKGGGDHVANAGYLTAAAARGQGVARAMLAHSLDTARDRGFRAMQFNFVIATNTRAIATWERAGFAVVGRLPAAFRHPREGLVDALVMHRAL